MFAKFLDYACHVAGLEILDAALIDSRLMGFLAGRDVGARRVLLHASAGEARRWASVVLAKGADWLGLESVIDDSI